MPNTSSAKKALRQSESRRVRNLSQKREMKKLIKNYKNLLAQDNFDEAKVKLSIVYKALDKTAKSGVIKKNKASRMKSRLTAQLNKASAPKTT